MTLLLHHGRGARAPREGGVTDRADTHTFSRQSLYTMVQWWEHASTEVKEHAPIDPATLAQIRDPIPQAISLGVQFS